MAVKKSTPKTSGTKKAAPKKAAPKKSAPKKAAPKASAAKKAPKKAAPKKAVTVKLTDKQQDLLEKIAESKQMGYLGPKAEIKAIESLTTKKLVKRGAKDKASGSYRYMVSKAGEKHLSAPATPPSA